MSYCDEAVLEGPLIYGRKVYRLRRPAPMIGHIAFGIIDRGTNVVQVRPSTLCFHNCIFCSVDAGPSSVHRASEYLVDDVEWLASYVEEVAKYKGEPIEALIDGVGEPLTSPRILDLISALKSKAHVKRVAIETHGGSLSLQLAKRLEEAGLDRINLSLDATDPSLAKTLTGSSWYDSLKIVNVLRDIVQQTKIDVVLTPVVVPGYNELELKGLIALAKELGLGTKSGWPTGILIQKYEVHRFGRKPSGVKPWSWSQFYSYLRRLEAETGYRLIVKPEELGFRRLPRVEKPFKVNDKVKVRIVADGWLKGEYLAFDDNCTRVITVLGRGLAKGSVLRVRIVSNENNIYMARPL